MITHSSHRVRRALAAGAVGTVGGSAIGGLTTLLTHVALVPNSTWLQVVPALVLLGAISGAVLGGVTRWQLGAHWPRRVAAFSAAGALVLPLFVAIGLPWANRTLITATAFAGWLGTTALWLARSRRQRRRRAGQPSSRTDRH